MFGDSCAISSQTDHEDSAARSCLRSFRHRGPAILVGGRAIFAFTKTEPVLAEMEGIGPGVVCGALALAAKSAEDDSNDGEDSSGGCV